MQNTVDKTLEERGNRYGTIENTAKLTQALMDEVLDADVLTGASLTPVHRECLHMIMHKVARMACGDAFYKDNPHDIAGYATLLEGYIRDCNGEEG